MKFALLLISLFLFACTDIGERDNPVDPEYSIISKDASSEPNKVSGIATVENLDELPKCTEWNDGDIIYVEEEGKTLYCNSEYWSSTDGTYTFLQDPHLDTVSYTTDASEYDASANTLKDLRDGKTYRTVTIGKQIWMAENLNYNYNKGSARSYCYDNDGDYCDKYGRLYTWAAAMDSAAVFSDAGEGCGHGRECIPSGSIRGVCPEGWHLPSDDEWETLFEAVGGRSAAGEILKSSSEWYGGYRSDSIGYSVLPAGYYDDYGFYGIDYSAYFWSSTEYSEYSAHNWEFDNYETYVYYDYDSKYYGYSVRCLSDSEGSEAVSPSSSSSEVAESVTYGTFTDDRDKQTYKTVTIGD